MLGWVAAGTGLSLLGGAKNKGTPVQQDIKKEGFAALPKPVQDMWLDQYLRDVANLYNQGNQTPPMARARTGRYDSQGLKELQAYADNLSRMQNLPGAMMQGQAQQQMPMQNNVNNFLNDPTVDKERELELRKMYQSMLKPGDRTPIGRSSIDHNFGDKTYDPFIANDFLGGANSYQKWRNAIIGGNNSSNIASNIGNVMAGNAPMGANAGMSGVDSQGNAGMGINNSGSRSLFGPGMNDQNGVRPLPGIEPFNQLQENAFDQLQNNQPRSVEDFTNAYSIGGLNALSQMAAYNPMEKSLDSYMNPYTDSVINRTLSRMGDELSGGENTILGNAAKFGGLGAFGSTAVGTMLANRQNEALKRAQDFVADQYQTNFGQAQNQRNMEINRRGQFLNSLIGGGNDTYKIAGGLQAVNNDQKMQSLQALLGAGNQVQAQGQAEIDAVNPLIQQNLPQNKLNRFGQQLSMFPGSIQSFQYADAPMNSMQRYGNALMGLGNLGNGFANAMNAGIGGMKGGRIGSLGGYI